MSAAAMRMPLCTSPAVPHFCGAPNNLPRYLAEVDSLCQNCQWATNVELIKYAIYYTDEMSWDTFAAVRDTLDDPKAWDEFKAVIHDLYPIRKAAHIPAPLPASLPLPLPVPCALLLPPLPTAIVLLTPDALHALLLSCAPSMLAATPMVPLLPLPAAQPMPPALTHALCPVAVAHRSRPAASCCQQPAIAHVC
jgi:hypothetical protein